MKFSLLLAAFAVVFLASCAGPSPRIVDTRPWNSEFRFKGYEVCRPDQVEDVVQSLRDKASAKGANCVMLVVETEQVFYRNLGVGEAKKVSVLGLHDPHPSYTPTTHRWINDDNDTINVDGRDLQVLEPTQTMLWKRRISMEGL